MKRGKWNRRGHLNGTRGASGQDVPSAELVAAAECVHSDPTIGVGATAPLSIMGEKLLGDVANVDGAPDSTNEKQFPETD